MEPILTVEFSAKAGDQEFREESVALHSTDELFAFVAPGGGCESIPSEVAEIRMTFLPRTRPAPANPIAEAPATLQVGIVLFHGPLTQIADTAAQLLERGAGGRLSASFRRVLHLNP